MLGTGKSNSPSSTTVSRQVSFFIASSGVTQGPPLADQPSQLCIPISRPRRWASLNPCTRVSRQADELKTLSPLGIPLEIVKICTPPNPAADNNSRSFVSPGAERLPFITNIMVLGRVSCGGFENSLGFNPAIACKERSNTHAQVLLVIVIVPLCLCFVYNRKPEGSIFPS